MFFWVILFFKQKNQAEAEPNLIAICTLVNNSKSFFSNLFENVFAI